MTIREVNKMNTNSLENVMLDFVLVQYDDRKNEIVAFHLYFCSVFRDF